MLTKKKKKEKIIELLQTIKLWNSILEKIDKIKFKKNYQEL